MKIYNYNPITNEFMYESEAQLDPLESKLQNRNIYMIPPYATHVKPLPNEAGKVNVLNPASNKWSLVEDNRGTVVYNKKTGEKLVIEELGPIPDGYTTEEPFIPQIGRIETLKEINTIYDTAYARKVQAGKIKANIEERTKLLPIYNNMAEDEIYYYNTEEEVIPLTKPELKEVLDILYERSRELAEKKNSYVAQLKTLRSKKSMDKLVETARKELV